MNNQLIVVDASRLDSLEKTINDLKEAYTDRKLEDVFNEIFEPKFAADYLKISTRYLQDLKTKGEIKFSQYEKIVRYRRSDLDEWFNRHQVGKRK